MWNSAEIAARVKSGIRNKPKFRDHATGSTDASWRKRSLNNFRMTGVGFPSVLALAFGLVFWPSVLAEVQAACAMTGCEQCAQRRASMGISLRHSGHFLVVGSTGAGALRIRATSRLTGVTTKK